VPPNEEVKHNFDRQSTNVTQKTTAFNKNSNSKWERRLQSDGEGESSNVSYSLGLKRMTTFEGKLRDNSKKPESPSNLKSKKQKSTKN